MMILTRLKMNVISNDVPFTDQSSTKDTGKKEEFTSDTQYPNRINQAG